MRKRRTTRRAYEIEYAPEVQDHLSRLTKRAQTMILDTVPRQLAPQPGVPTRNRKPLDANPVAPWELRIGDYRLYFDVKEQPAHSALHNARGRYVYAEFRTDF